MQSGSLMNFKVSGPIWILVHLASDPVSLPVSILWKYFSMVDVIQVLEALRRLRRHNIRGTAERVKLQRFKNTACAGETLANGNGGVHMQLS